MMPSHGDHSHPHDDHDHGLDAQDVGGEGAPGQPPLDAANQSLADALRTSFGILKTIMVILAILYLFSNVRGIGGHEEALVLRLGALHRVVRDPGLVWAFPYPIDEIVTLPTKKSNELLIDSHTFRRRPDEVGKPLSFISRGEHQGLNPAVDGALMTADNGLVHVQWKLIYKIDDVGNYVQHIQGSPIEAAERLIRTVVETVAIHVAGELSAEEMIRTRVDHVQSEMRRRVNEQLAALTSGITVSTVEMFEPTPPIPVRADFDNSLRAENTKQKRIREAEKERTQIVSDAAGAAYPKVVAMLDAIEAGDGGDRSPEALRTELDRLLMEEVEGQAGRIIKDAGAFFSVVTGRIQSDVERYQTLLPEYRRNPVLLIERLWQHTWQEILNSSGVTKFYRPSGLRQLWIKVPLDPEQTRLEEAKRLREKEFDPGTLRPETYHPIGPED